MTRGRRLLSLALTAAFVLVWFVVLRPASLGGWLTYVVIRGDSMLPTYETGDLVILAAKPTYGPTDVIGYRVPAGELGGGLLVVHRIVDTVGEQFVIRGDNNPAPDPWQPTVRDVAGAAVGAIPGVGRVLAWIHQPAVIASGTAAFVVGLVLLRTPPTRAAMPARPRTMGRRRA